MLDAPSEYCERLIGIGIEPINALSSLALILAAALAFYTLRKESGVLKFLLPLLLALAGGGSLWWHMGHTTLGDIADSFFVLLFASAVGLLFLRKILHSWISTSVAFFVLLVVTLTAERLYYLNDSLPYLVLLVGLSIGGVVYARKFPDSRSRIISAVGVFALAILFRSLDLLVCSALPIGTHFMWHVLVAIVGYQLILLVARK